MLGTKNIYLYKKYEDFQFSIINESKTLKTETGTKCQEKIAILFIHLER